MIASRPAFRSSTAGGPGGGGPMLARQLGACSLAAALLGAAMWLAARSVVGGDRAAWDLLQWAGAATLALGAIALVLGLSGPGRRAIAAIDPRDDDSAGMTS